MPKNEHTLYNERLCAQLWSYQEARFTMRGDLFDAKYSHRPNPPVFATASAHLNVVVPDDPAAAAAICGQLPERKRHKWFRSMRSSQALAASVFGALAAQGAASRLKDVAAEDAAGLAFGVPESLELEFDVQSLNEKTPTSVDVLVKGTVTVCVECKLSEPEVGSCSRLTLPRRHENRCDGTYGLLQGRTSPCQLTRAGIKYWDYIPAVFRWEVDGEPRPCPIAANYQLVRNVLAACVHDGRIRTSATHALLVYDARNPAFAPHPGGTFEKTRDALREPSLLRRCSWQSILRVLADYRDLAWLIDGVDAKYGLRPARAE